MHKTGLNLVFLAVCSRDFHRQAKVLELKAVEGILPIHEAQTLTYMRLGGWKVGLILNFNVPVLVKGVKRLVLGLKE